MPRYAFKIEYDGEPFNGWQRQTNHPSVQQELERALLALESTNEGVTAAGRTDKGVHATGQVVHTDMVKNWTPFRLTEALNFHLKPLPISIVDCVITEDDFHARFSALERTYLFRLVSRRASMPLVAGRCWQVRFPLDLDAMQEAANHLLGTHDFTTFRSSVCQGNSPIRTLDELSIKQIDLGDATEFQFTVRARSFLHNQVRSFVGTLERVGVGYWDPIQVKTALESRNRASCGPVSPPYGLYLAHVEYPTKPFDPPESKITP